GTLLQEQALEREVPVPNHGVRRAGRALAEDAAGLAQGLSGREGSGQRVRRIRNADTARDTPLPNGEGKVPDKIDDGVADVLVVEDAVPGPDGGAIASTGAVGDADARAEVVPVGIDDAAPPPVF